MLPPSERHREIADEVYQDFCESDLNNHPFQEAWDAYEAKFGDIVIGSEVERLVSEAIAYAIQVGVDNYCDPSELPKKEG